MGCYNNVHPIRQRGECILLLKKENEEMNGKDGDFAKGCLIGIGLSIPVWAFVIWVLFRLF